VTATAPASSTPTPAPNETGVAPTPTAVPSDANEPLGFPIDPSATLGLVEGAPGSRSIRWGAGPEAGAYTRDDQVSDEADRANRSGWNCGVHVEYEGQPAVDWYIPAGTPVRSTMDGTATLYVITISNAFDYYGVDREPYLGNPDRNRAPLSPFAGPGGGKGVFVSVESDEFVTEYAHLDLTSTLPAAPAGAFLEGYSPTTEYAALFEDMRDYRDATAIASWPVDRGDMLGMSGDAGYSEGPHLHYTVRRAGGGLLCPTGEAGFEDGGWLLK
jgi:murein DD-endopeptidase MepM/ murein hydrolase activator NlpD